MEATIWNLADLIDLKARMEEMEAHRNWDRAVDQILERKFLVVNLLYPISNQVIKELKIIQFIKIWNNLLILLQILNQFSR